MFFVSCPSRVSRLLVLCGCVMGASLPAQQIAHPTLPLIVQKDGRYALLVDGEPYLMLGAQMNNSSAWPAMLPKVWPTVARLGANTLEAPIYWEQFEPEPGKFDPSMLYTLLTQARAHHVHLVLLWFGTWKNGSGHYTPAFVKLDEAKYPHSENKQGRKVDSLATTSEYTLDADRTAFVELMKDLKAADPQHTVLMVQVENEAGTWGSVRDYSLAAQRLFEGQVPVELVQALRKEPGTWSQVFGSDADESFQAYSVANYINKVAEAGKAVYPLPMYVNVATRDPFHATPGSYESGNATDNMIPIWKAMAKGIDVFGPDLYTPGYEVYTKLLDIYHRPDNAMFVPETGNAPGYARYLFAAVGHQTIGFSPFGMDATGFSNAPLGATKVDEETLAPFALVYSIFGPMDRVVAKLNFEGKVQGVSQDPEQPVQRMDFGKWKAKVSYGLGQFANAPAVDKESYPDGGAMVAQLGPDEFLVTGVHARVDFEVADAASGLQRQFLRVEEGTYQNGVWHFVRVWNGDQTDWGLNFTSVPQVLRVTLATY